MIRWADPRDRPGRARQFRCTVHGLCFDNRYRLLGRVRVGDPVHLEREPENEIGTDAIRVRIEGRRTIGYVPREISRWLAPLLDAGYRAEARVLKVRRGRPYYERLLIKVVIRSRPTVGT